MEADIVQVAAPMVVNVLSVPANHHVHKDGRVWPIAPTAQALVLIEQLERTLAETVTGTVATPVAVPIEDAETVVAFRRPAEPLELEPEPEPPAA